MGDMRLSFLIKFKFKNVRFKIGGKFVKSVVREFIEVFGYERKW